LSFEIENKVRESLGIPLLAQMEQAPAPKAPKEPKATKEPKEVIA